jgi:hypothetical protein
MIVFRWLLPLLVALMASPSIAQAASINASWNNPTQNTDGTSIPASGPGSITGTLVEWGTCAGTAFGTKAGEQFVASPATSVRIDNLAPATHCVRAFSRNTFGQQSAASNVLARTITAPVPNPPTLTTVAVVAGLNMAPLYRINADGSRGSALLGFMPTGEACDGPVVYRYRGADYRRPKDFSTVKWWGTAPTTSAAAPCA